MTSACEYHEDSLNFADRKEQGVPEYGLDYIMLDREVRLTAEHSNERTIYQARRRSHDGLQGQHHTPARSRRFPEAGL